MAVFLPLLHRLRALPDALSEKKFKRLTECSRVSRFSKEEFEAYRKVYHNEWDHNAMVDGIFEDFADEINAEIAKNVSKSLLKRNREIAKKMKARNRPIDEIVEDTGLTKEEVEAL